MSVQDLFLWPGGLFLLLLLPFLALLLRALDRSLSRGTERALGPRAARLSDELGPGCRDLRRRLCLGGLFLAMVTVLQPLGKVGAGTVEQRGVDLLVCLDVSQSMLARDLPPSRLLSARREIRALAERVRGDRLGLVAFAGEARLIVPLTQDTDSLAGLLELVDPLSVQKGGTDLGAALEVALEVLQGQTGDHEAILLLTDGEDLHQRGLRVAERCRDRGITVHCVGFGSPRGSKITVEEGEGEAFLRDGAGQEVVSAMDPASLRRIAEVTGGAYLNAGSRPLPLVDLYDDRIRSMARKSFVADERRQRRNHFQWPLLAACMFWIIELGVSERRGRR